MYVLCKGKIFKYKKDRQGVKTTFYFKLTFITQKHGYQTGLDTLVVHAVTDECLKFIIFIKFLMRNLNIENKIFLQMR